MQRKEWVRIEFNGERFRKKRRRDGCGMRERIFRGAMNKYEYEQEIEWEKKSVVYERENILTN